MSNIKRYLDDLDEQILYHEGETEQLKRQKNLYLNINEKRDKNA